MFNKHMTAYTFILVIGFSLAITSHCLIQYISAIDVNQLRQAELRKHNELRARHGCPPLVLDATLNNAAQAYSAQLYKAGTLSHSPAAQKGTYGQNLYWTWRSPTLTYSPGAASLSWYNEVKYYNYTTFKSTDPSKAVGHFTAMIWKSATKVGFGYTYGPQRGGYGIYVVANYAPVTNVIGKYASNVPKPVI